MLNIKKPLDTKRNTKPQQIEDILSQYPKPKVNGRYSKEEFKDMFPYLFSGKLGCAKNIRVHLDLDPSIQPVRQKLWPIPFHLRDAISKEIEKQIEMRILERVTDEMGLTPWVANIVPVLKTKESQKMRGKKPREIQTEGAEMPEACITVNKRAQNKVIRRTMHPARTVEDLLYAVNGMKVSSKLDIFKAFHQLMLEEIQMNLTVILTHIALLRYRRLHMGISCASEIFTEVIRRMLEDKAEQTNMTDDVLIYGKTEEDHQKALLKVLKRLQKRGLTLNLEKCEFNKSEITFFGLRFTADGVSPTVDRIKALKEAKEPENTKALNSFLCTVL